MPDDAMGPTDDEILDSLTGALRRCGIIPSPSSPGERHPLARAGLKLKGLRQRSGWTLPEIAARTGVRLEILRAFERGDSAAAGELTCFDLECLASACCGSLADLLGPEHPWVKASTARQSGWRSKVAVNPHG